METVHERFEKQVARTPNATAVCCRDEMLTYRELNERANRLAHFLQKNGVTSDSFVGIHMERSLDIVVATLGILKAGAAYVPLDPAYPHERLLQMLAGVRLDLTLSRNGRGSWLPGKLVDVADAAEQIARESGLNLHSHQTERAYLLFTSGSTGKPRGVVGSHLGVINRIDWMLREWPLHEDEAFCLRTSFNFVDAVWDVFQPLLNGCLLIVATNSTVENHEEFLSELERHRVSRLSIGPAHLRALLNHEPHLGRRLPHLWILDVTGEQFSGELAKKVRESVPQAVVFNRYGCTEAPSCMLFNAQDYNQDIHGELLPIGAAIGNTSLFIIGEDDKPVAPGEVGELVIGGAQVALGYYNDPTLTDMKFSKRSVSGVEEQIYRTGDQAKIAEDGHLICLGRMDAMVKVRGNRVEVDEVEAILNAHPAVEIAAVVVTGHLDNKSLYGCYVAKDDVSSDNMRTWLRGKIPDYMIPSRLKRLNKMPLLPNGKIDRQHIVNSDASPSLHAYIAPHTRLEETLCVVIGEAFRVERLSIKDSFLDLGMDSIGAMQVVARLSKTLGVRVPMGVLLIESTVEKLAEWIGSAAAVHADLVVNASHENHVIAPMSYPQMLLWRIDQRLGRSKHVYNDTWAIRLRGNLDLEALKGAFRDLVEHHAALRTLFSETADGHEVQAISNPGDFPLSLIDISRVEGEQQEDILKKAFIMERRQHFDLQNGPLLVGKLYRLADGKHVLILSAHHIAEDAWSGQLINKSLSRFYDARIAGAPEAARPLAISYTDFAVWQERMVAGGSWVAQLAYWRRQLRGMQGRPPGLLDHEPAAGALDYDGALETIEIPAELVEPVKQLAREEQATLFMAMLGAFYTALHRYTNWGDLSVGSPIAHRHYEGTQDIVGFFPNMLVFRQHVHGDMGCRELLRQVKSMALDAYAHQDVPFIKVAEALGANKGPDHPLVAITFIMPAKAPRVGESLNLRGIEAELLRLPSECMYAKFDLSAVALEKTNGRIEFQILYRKSRFRRESILKLMELYRDVLRETGEEAHR